MSEFIHICVCIVAFISLVIAYFVGLLKLAFHCGEPISDVVIVIGACLFVSFLLWVVG